jgi:Tol biopolymer transport system component
MPLSFAAIVLSVFGFFAGGDLTLPGMSPALSPDGRTLAYFRFDETRSDFGLFLRNLKSGEERSIDRSTFPAQVSWSRDGRRIAYAQFSAGGASKLIVFDAGGQRRSAFDIDDAAPPVGVDWLSENHLVVATHDRFVIVNSRTGEPRLLLDLARRGLRGDFSAIGVSPSGVIAFAANNEGSSRRSIWTIDALSPDKKPRRRTSGHDDASPSWAGTDLLFSRVTGNLKRDGSEAALMHVWRLTAGGRASEITTGRVADVQPVWSRRTGMLAFCRLDPAVLVPEGAAGAGLQKLAQALANAARDSRIVMMKWAPSGENR